MRGATRLLTALATASLVGAVGASPALASCMFDERSLEQQVAEADVVFVGTVESTRHGGSTATFRVEEVWRSTVDLPDLVEVVGGSGQDGAVTSVDRSYTDFERYLVFPFADGNRLADNSCSPTRPWSEDLAAARPDDAEVRGSGSDPTVVDVEPTTTGTGDDAPEEAIDDGTGDGFPVGGAALVAVGLTLAGAATWRVTRA